MKDARERVHRIENPTISNMVMTYYEHRDEVAKGYERGTKKAQLGNLQYVSKVQVYIEQNNLTTVDDVERIISEKNDLLKQAKDGLDNKKSELKRIKKNLSLIDNYYENKPVYEESRKIFFKAKQNEYREKHHAEIYKFQKAKRILSEQGYDEPSFEICREMWTDDYSTHSAPLGRSSAPLDRTSAPLSQSAYQRHQNADQPPRPSTLNWQL